jgi:hypothetical protein
MADANLMLERAQRFLGEHPAATEHDVREHLRELYLNDEQKFQANVWGSPELFFLWPVALFRKWRCQSRLAAFEQTLDDVLQQLRAQGRFPSADRSSSS